MILMDPWFNILGICFIFGVFLVMWAKSRIELRLMKKPSKNVGSEAE